MKTLTLQEKITIDKPVETVFEYISTHENHEKIFSANVSSKQVTEGPMGVGTKVTNVAKFMGSTMEEKFEIIQFEKNKVIEKKSIPGSTHPTADKITFYAKENSTEIVMDVIAWPTGFFKYILPIITPMVRSILKKDLKNMKNLIESL